MARLYLTVSDEDMAKYDKGCEKNGMSRSMYLGYLLSGCKDQRPPVIRYRELIRHMDSIDKQVKVISLKECLSDDDRICLMEKLAELKELITDRCR
ncbi:MAG: hypothetical protein K6E75_06095 [Lachnospiraceae bacterium]|nr:hypothetical protein [Lachnospiraceae bacterium]